MLSRKLCKEILKIEILWLRRTLQHYSIPLVSIFCTDCSLTDCLVCADLTHSAVH